MIVKTKYDFTQLLASASGAVEVAGEAEYPADPAVNETVFDMGLEVVKCWDGEKWGTIPTRVGMAQE